MGENERNEYEQGHETNKEKESETVWWDEAS